MQHRSDSNPQEKPMTNQQTTRRSQHGLGLLGILFVLGVLGFVGAVGMQVFPTAIEYMAIQKAVSRAKSQENAAAIRSAFDRAGAIDDFKSISGKDLVIEKVANGHTVKFAYEKEIHLFSMAYLVMKYEGGSHK
jgi:hypothetical protein